MFLRNINVSFMTTFLQKKKNNHHILVSRLACAVRAIVNLRAVPSLSITGFLILLSMGIEPLPCARY
ncbi:hypothetical protein, partial [[Eubacterium] cellulosolvens]